MALFCTRWLPCPSLRWGLLSCCWSAAPQSSSSRGGSAVASSVLSWLVVLPGSSVFSGAVGGGSVATAPLAAASCVVGSAKVLSVVLWEFPPVSAGLTKGSWLAAWKSPGGGSTVDCCGWGGLSSVAYGWVAGSCIDGMVHIAGGTGRSCAMLLAAASLLVCGCVGVACGGG